MDTNKSFKLSNEEFLSHIMNLQKIMEAITDGIFIIVNNDIIIANENLSRILNITSEDISLEKVRRLFSNADDDAIIRYFEKLDKLESFGPVRLNIQLSNLQTKTFELTCNPIAYLDRDMLICVLVDVTEELNVKSKLYNSINLFTSVLDSIDDAIFILNPSDFTLRRANKPADRIFKMDFSSLKGITLWDNLADLSLRDDIKQQIDERLAKSGTLHFDFEMRRSDFSTFPALHTVSQVKDQNGDVIAIMWTIADMSQQAYLNRALSDMETQYRILFERSADAILMFDVATRKIINANYAAEVQLGYKRSDLIGRTAFDITPQSRYDSMEDDIEMLFKEGTYSFQGVNLNKNNNEIPVQINAVTTTFGNRSIYIMTCRDISIQLEREREKLRLEKLETVRQVVGGIAHELTQPLQTLTVISELMNQIETPPDKRYELTQKSIAQVERMMDLLNQMKRLVRLSMKTYIDTEKIIDFKQSTALLNLLIVDVNKILDDSVQRKMIERGVNPLIVNSYQDAFKSLKDEPIEIIAFVKEDNQDIDQDMRQWVEKFPDRVRTLEIDYLPTMTARKVESLLQDKLDGLLNSN